MDKIMLETYLKQGLSTRKIAPLVGKGKSTVSYWIHKHGLQDLQKYKKPEYSNIHYFQKIENPKQAYILGFILGDGCIQNNGLIISIALADKEINEFIQSELGCNIQDSHKIDKAKRIFPSSNISIGNSTLVDDIKMLAGGTGKDDRHVPIIKQELERYVLLGFFDAEGCVTWGRRKDRNRIWQKISFTSSYNLLLGIQKILLKNGISTAIRPKANEKCFVMEFAAKDTVLKFLDLIYPNDEFIILNRKYKKAQALRLELGEFGEA